MEKQTQDRVELYRKGISLADPVPINVDTYGVPDEATPDREIQEAVTNSTYRGCLHYKGRTHQAMAC